MPRQRKVTMGTVTPDEAHEAAIKLAIKKGKPYKLIAKHSFMLTKERRWMIVYVAGSSAKPTIVVDDIKKAKKGRSMLKLLERAWAEGHYVSSSR